jgi:NitT/TauT family transport system permease protein
MASNEAERKIAGAPDAEAINVKSERPPSRFRTLLRHRLEWILSPLLLVAVLGFWEWFVDYAEIPTFLVPPPSLIAVSLVGGLSKGLTDQSGYYIHMGYTLWEAFFGFIIGTSLGVLLGTIISQNRLVEKTLLPYIIAFQAMPKIAVAPLFVVWMGFGMTSKVVMVITLTFFPVLINALAGFKSVPQNRVDMARALCASEWQIFRHVKFPSSLPFIFAGLEIAVTFAIVGAIVGEFVGADRGIGLLIMQSQYQMDVPGVFAGLLLLSLVGVALQLAMERWRRRVLFWEAEQLARPRRNNE